MAVLGAKVQRTSASIQHTVEATKLFIPEGLLEVTKPRSGKLPGPFKTGVDSQPRRHAGYAGLKFQRFVVVAGRPPGVVEVTQKAAVPGIDTARATRVNQGLQFRNTPPAFVWQHLARLKRRRGSQALGRVRA